MSNNSIRNAVFISVVISLMSVSCGKGNRTNDDVEMKSPDIGQSEAYVDTMHLHMQDFNKQIVCNGRLSARYKSDLSFGTNDIVTDIYVKNGQRVAKGAVIASTDKREKLREVEKAEHELERARVELMDKLISLGYSANMKDVPEDVMKRAEIISGFYTAKFALRSAKTALEECNLKAPFPGRVVDMVGRPYQHNDKICTLVDDSQYDVEFKILESELPNVNVGQKVKITPFINDDTSYEGVVSQINPTVEDNGLIKVTARMDNSMANNDIIDGLNVKVVIEQQVRRMFVVPKDAVVERDGYHVVFLYDEGKAIWTYVDVLYSNIDSYAITGCEKKETTIKEGDIVITSGNLNLADETEVSISN